MSKIITIGVAALAGAAVMQLWTGWKFASALAIAVWLVVCAEEVAAAHHARMTRIRSGCPYCRWKEPHKKGPDCT